MKNSTLAGYAIGTVVVLTMFATLEGCAVQADAQVEAHGTVNARVVPAACAPYYDSPEAQADCQVTSVTQATVCSMVDNTVWTKTFVQTGWTDEVQGIGKWATVYTRTAPDATVMCRVEDGVIVYAMY